MSWLILLILLVMSILCFWAYRLYVEFMKEKMVQYIREDAPVHHHAKSGTPTAGGLIFSLFILLSSLIINILYSIPLFSIFLVLFLGSFFIGFYDDLMKILNKRNLGIRARDKLFLQFIITLITFFLMKFNNSYFVNNFSINFSEVFFHHNAVDLGWLYLLFLYFFISGISNGTNLTDGQDGLLASLSIFTFLGYITIFLVFFNISLVYLLVSIILFILVFLYYNFPRAKVFMGDCGSMAIGAMFVYFSIVSKTEIYFLFLGYIYFLVTLSVILQVLYFKITKGKRLFNFTPLHHHFELMGYNERDILKIFNIVNLVFILIGLFLIALKFYT